MKEKDVTVTPAASMSVTDDDVTSTLCTSVQAFEIFFSFPLSAISDNEKAL